MRFTLAYQVRNSTLHQAYIDYTKRALAMLRSDVRRDGMPLGRETSWERVDGGGCRRHEAQIPAWEKVVDRCESRLRALEEYKNVVARMAEDRTVSSQINRLFGTRWSAARVETDQFVNYATFAMAKGERPKYRKAAATKLYQEIESFFYSDNIEQEILVPLDGLKLHLRELRLNDHLSLVQMGDEQIRRLLDINVQLGHSFGNYVHDIADCAIRLRYASPKRGEDDPELPYSADSDDRLRFGREASRVVEMLRLAKAGDFWPIGVFQFQRHLSGRSVSYGLTRIPRSAGRINYLILPKDRRGMRQLWRVFDSKAVKERRFLANAIHRFASAMEKDVLEDRLIDLMIAAESLFLNDDHYQGELRYRFSHRIAVFQHKKPSDRTKLFKVLKGIYDARSQILNGTSEELKFVKKDDGTEFTLAEYCDILGEFFAKRSTS